MENKALWPWFVNYGCSVTPLLYKYHVCNHSISRVPTISPVISPSSDKQVKQGSNKEEQLTDAWVEAPWQAEDEAIDVQLTKLSEE